MKRPTLQSIGTALASAGLIANLAGLGMLAMSTSALAAQQATAVQHSADEWGADTSSAITQQWANPRYIGDRDRSSAAYEQMQNISVTVAQTKDITNQGIVVKWSGASPTPAGVLTSSFFQVMQCWGDDSTGPTAQQCQWGGVSKAIGAMLGDRVGTRSLKIDEDPAQDYTDEYKVPPPRTNPNLKAYTVPFTAVDGTTVTDPQDYFTSGTTNELSALRTSADGTGVAVFTAQTALEAPHLGCGQVMTNGKPRSCWLVVVPRGTTTANGTSVSDLADGTLTGSPLTATNWANRLVFPLSFQAIGANCPLGNAEQRLVGHEVFSDAMTSWQSSLCASGTTYGWSQIGDSEARTQLVSSTNGAAHLGVISTPISSSARGTNILKYAPIARNALVIGYNIERSIKFNSDRLDASGTPIESLTLNARLVAKLLTQSYRADVPSATADPVKSNPYSIVTDPEFVQLNPEFSDFLETAAPEGLLVSLGSSDANAQVWRWLRADADAKSFLEGKDDGYGMRINPAYIALNLATEDTDSFPKADLSSFRYNDLVPEPGYGTLDLRPYMSDMQDAAIKIQRGESGSKVVWDQFRLPPAFVSGGAQLPGQRFEIGITTLTAAERFGLRTAKIVNASGAAISPTATSINAAIDDFTASSDESSVRVFSPQTKDSGAYPLAAVSYAAVNVCKSTAAERKAYAGFLTYAAGSGQITGHAKGQLPPGYIPLSSADTNALASLSTLLRDDAAIDKLCPADTATEPKTTAEKKEKKNKDEAPSPDSTSAATAPVSPSADLPTDVSAPAPTASPAAGGTAAQVATIDPITTAKISTNAWRVGAAGTLSMGVPCMILGPWLLRRSRRLPN
ncbi:hypothetical protein [Rarobacter incanus]|uniref:PBP domain-containing protein n=1 Tax=Rarobacter incanus TaxID=153494 RepID=A0A542SRI5_9MICO|nr:hypothetical protein [Rarobacter incanus]TQK77213.1 hypothetical protein FB389_1929 [Rarobacter incanus]